jgi:hypothetical protein
LFSRENDLIINSTRTDFATFNIAKINKIKEKLNSYENNNFTLNHILSAAYILSLKKIYEKNSTYGGKRLAIMIPVDMRRYISTVPAVANSLSYISFSREISQVDSFFDAAKDFKNSFDLAINRYEHFAVPAGKYIGWLTGAYRKSRKYKIEKGIPDHLSRKEVWRYFDGAVFSNPGKVGLNDLVKSVYLIPPLLPPMSCGLSAVGLRDQLYVAFNSVNCSHSEELKATFSKILDDH